MRGGGAVVHVQVTFMAYDYDLTLMGRFTVSSISRKPATTRISFYHILVRYGESQPARRD